MSNDRPYCFVTLFVGLRREDWLCGVEDCVDLIVYLDRVLFVVCGAVEASRFRLAVLLHSFRSFASLLICLSPVLDIGGLGCVLVIVSGLCVCMGQIWVAMSWHSCIIVMYCAAA